jgi:hypothetical protein
VAEPWIRVHANLVGKPVVWRAVEALGVKQHEAIGLLVQFWGSVSQHATNGHVVGSSDAQLEVWAGWRGKRGKFAAFIRSMHLDPDGRVNEWDEYAGKLEGRREQERTRKQRERERRSRLSHADSHADNDVTSLPTIRNETKRTDVVDDLARNDLAEPAVTAIYLAVWANGAVAERWSEQPNPYTQGSAIELSDELQALGVAWETVKASIYRQCRESKMADPPRSVAYFGPGIKKDIERERARVALERSGERPPPSMARGSKINPGAQMVANILGGNRD